MIRLMNLTFFTEFHWMFQKTFTLTMSGNRNQSKSGGSKTNWGGWADVMAAVQQQPVKEKVYSTTAATTGVDVADMDSLSCSVASYSDEGEEASSPVGRGRTKRAGPSFYGPYASVIVYPVCAKVVDPVGPKVVDPVRPKVERQAMKVGNKPNWLQQLMDKETETKRPTGVHNQDQESETAETDPPKA